MQYRKLLAKKTHFFIAASKVSTLTVAVATNTLIFPSKYNVSMLLQ
jgi:hypothetical protein